jgi:hypothetical protein
VRELYRCEQTLQALELEVKAEVAKLLEEGNDAEQAPEAEAV